MDGSSDSPSGPRAPAPEAAGDADQPSVVALARSLVDRIALLRAGAGDAYELRLAHALALDIVDLLEVAGRR